MCSIDINEVKTRFSQSGIDFISHDVHPGLQKKETPLPQANWMLQFASGAISGPVSRTITAPLDRMRLQIQVTPEKQSIFQAWKALMENGGIPGLWRGNGINVAKVAPEMAIRFSVFDKVKQMFSVEGQPLSVQQRFMSGALAGVAGQLAIFPIEVLKIRMMVRKPGEFTGTFHAIRKIYQTEGIRAFYRGYVSSATGIIPYTGMDLTIYETLKNTFVFPNLEPGEKPPAWKLLTCACISITCGQYSSYPFYLIKARQQAKSTHPSVLKIQQEGGCHLCKMFLYILKTDGVTGLYRGVLLTLAKVLPAGIINYYIYERARRYLSPYF